jgi:hypothetical protein
MDEPWRVDKLRKNSIQFISGLKQAGFDTLNTETAIVPVVCGEDETAYRMTQYGQHHDVFVLPVVSPAVPPGLARLRATSLQLTSDYQRQNIIAGGRRSVMCSPPSPREVARHPAAGSRFNQRTLGMVCGKVGRSPGEFLPGRLIARTRSDWWSWLAAIPSIISVVA